jgi:hypothetical protein
LPSAHRRGIAEGIGTETGDWPFANNQPGTGRKSLMRHYSRYIHTGAGEEYRPIAEIVEKLDALEEEAATTNTALRKILRSFAAE